MCACRPNVRTPNCGSMQCLAAARLSAKAEAVEACIQVVGKYADWLHERGQKQEATYVHGARRELEALRLTPGETASLKGSKE